MLQLAYEVLNWQEFSTKMYIIWEVRLQVEANPEWWMDEYLRMHLFPADRRTLGEIRGNEDPVDLEDPGMLIKFTQ